MLSAYFLIPLIFCIVATPIHVIGLILLFSHEDSNIHGTQKYLIVSLSLTEISFLTLSTTRGFVWFTDTSTKIAGELIEAYSIIVSSNMYYFTMFAITVDRFLKIILNIRYPLYWKAKNTKTFLLIFFSILNGLYISYFSLVLIFAWHKMPLVMAKFYYSYIVPVFDITFVAIASGVYGYIFATIFKNRKADERLQKQVTGSTGNVSSTKIHVPFWIVLTFMLFWVLPDIMMGINITFQFPTEFYISNLILYRIGYMADPIIYIFNLKKVKLQIRRLKTAGSSLVH